MEKEVDYIVQRLGYQVVETDSAPIVQKLLQWLSKNDEKKIHDLAVTHPICPAWHYLLTIIYPEGNIELDEQSCNPQSLTWPLNTMIMQYLNQKIMQSGKSLEATQKILYFFSTNARNQLNDLKEENKILQNKLCETTKDLTYVLTGILYGHTNWVVSVAFSPHGKRLATGSLDNTIHIYDAKTYQLLHKLESKHLSSVAFSPDGKHLLSGNWDGSIHIYDAKTYQLLKTLKEANSLRSIAFSPNGKLLAVACGNDIHIYDITTYQLLKKVQVHTNYVNSVTFSTDVSLLASASDDKTIHIYDATTYELLKRIEESSAVTQLAFSSNSNHLACIIGLRKIHIYHLHTYQLIKKLAIDFEKNLLWSITFSLNSQFLAVGGEDGNIYLYKATDYELFKILKAHSDAVYSLAFSLYGTLASGSWDNNVKIWESMPLSNSHKEYLYDTPGNKKKKKAIRKSQNSDENSVLRAAKEGNLLALESLLEKGTNLKVTNTLEKNALHLAILYDQSIEMIKWLINIAKIPIDSQEFSNQTPFHYAARKGNIPVLKLLKEKGANLHATTFDGENALHIAVSYQQGKAIKWLLNNAGISIESKGFHGKTPLLYAAWEGSIPTIELLITQGADPHATDRHGRGALWYAKENLKENMVEFLKKI